METDRSIALLQKEQWMSRQEESRRNEKEIYDPKRIISYTLEELIQGVKSGKQFIYTLKLLFEMKTILDGRLKLPFILDFFDVIQEEAANITMASSLRNVSTVIACVPYDESKSIGDWITKTKERMHQMSLRIRILKTQTVNRLEYFCYELSTSEGDTYNVTFCFGRDGMLYTGTLNCLSTEKEGMGLLLEALVNVLEENNR